MRAPIPSAQACKRRAKREAEHGPWLLPEDGVIDERAIDAAAQGRPVRLTKREMEEVARQFGIPDHP